MNSGVLVFVHCCIGTFTSVKVFVLLPPLLVLFFFNLSTILSLNPTFALSTVFFITLRVTMVTEFHIILMLPLLPFCSKLCRHDYCVSHCSCAVSWRHVSPCHPLNSATTFPTSPSTCSWGEITETETLPQPTVRAPRLI